MNNFKNIRRYIYVYICISLNIINSSPIIPSKHVLPFFSRRHSKSFLAIEMKVPCHSTGGGRGGSRGGKGQVEWGLSVGARGCGRGSLERCQRQNQQHERAIDGMMAIRVAQLGVAGGISLIVCVWMPYRCCCSCLAESLSSDGLGGHIARDRSGEHFLQFREWNSRQWEGWGEGEGRGIKAGRGRTRTEYVVSVLY